MKGNSGFTILEVLIFIAVSSLMFVAAMVAIGGKQEEVQFTQGSREFDAKIRDIINDVSTGYFPTNETINCQVIAGEITISSSTGEKLGTNDQCIYIGKAIQFQPDGKEDVIRIYTIAGRRYQDDKLTPSSSIAASKPKAVALPGAVSGFVSSVEDFSLLYGLKVTAVMHPKSPLPTEYGIIGILSNFGSSTVSDSQATQIGGIRGSELGKTEAKAVSVINLLTDDVSKKTNDGYIEKNTKEGVVICLKSSEGKKASLTVGEGGGGSTTLNIDNFYAGCPA